MTLNKPLTLFFGMITIVALLFYPELGKAQDSLKYVKILDAQTLSPVEGTYFAYASKTGYSDANGIIALLYSENDMLFISHVAYGERTFTVAEVKAAIQSGIIKWEQRDVNLQPVTVIALRPKSNEKQVLELDVHDRLNHDAGALLNQTPVISSVRKSGRYGFDPVLRGFKYDQLNIVIDGAQSATAACPNRMDPPASQISPNMMERVDILKGPHSLRFGTSFGGTINFVTKSPVFSDKSRVYGRTSNSYENNGNVFRNEGMVGYQNSLYELDVFGSLSQGDNYKDGDETSVPAGFYRGSIGANLGVKISESQKIAVSATRNFARDVDFAALQMDLRDDDTWLVNARHTATINKGVLTAWNTSVYGTFVDHLMDNYSKNIEPRMADALTSAKTKTYGGRTEGTFRFGKNRVYTGTDIKIENAKGERERTFLMGPMIGNTVTDNVWQNGTLTKTGLFAEYQHSFSGSHIIASARLDIVHSDIDDAETEFAAIYSKTSASHVNPSVSVGGIRNFEHGIDVGLWLGRAQRSGNLTELYINYFPVGLDAYEMLGNPKLKPEINNQADLTFSWNHSDNRFELSLFASYLQDYISSEIREDLTPRLQTSPGVRQYTNIDEAMMTGFELSWSRLWPLHLQHQVSVAYTYGKNLDIDKPLPEIAPLDLRLTLSGTFLTNKLKPEISFRQVLKQDRVSDVYGETESKAFTLVDVKSSYRFSRLLNLSAGIRNLFDERYYEHLNRTVTSDAPHPIYAPGRNAFVTLSLSVM